MKEFKINDRYLDAMAIALNPNVYLLANEGTIRSQKTVSMIQAFFECVQMSDEKLHLITATDLDSIRDNILQSDFGLEIMYPQYIKRVKEEIGGYYLKVNCNIPGKPKDKKVLLVGFNNKKQWKKINGKTIGCVLGDEINTADPAFVRETFNRQASVKHPKQLWTLNGDHPKHWVYTEFINHCKIIGRDRTPASIIAEMDKVEKKKGYYYMHWNMHDNPIMTDEKIERASSHFPVGSYYHIIKILGERGAPGKLLYIDYLDADKHIKKLNVRDYNHFGIGFDIGATRAHNSISLIGFKRDFSKAGLIDKHTYKQCGYEQKTKYLIAFLTKHKDLNIKYVAVDSAEQNYITDLRNILKPLFPHIAIINSYKATIKQRVDLMIILLSHGQFEFNDTQEGKDAYDAFMVAKRSEKPNEVREDLNERHNDIIDSVEYAITRHMNALLKASKEYELFKDSEVA